MRRLALGARWFATPLVPPARLPAPYRRYSPPAPLAAPAAAFLAAFTGPINLAISGPVSGPRKYESAHRL